MQNYPSLFNVHASIGQGHGDVSPMTPRRSKTREPTSHHYVWMCGRCYEPQTAKQSDKTFRGHHFVPTQEEPWRVACKQCKGPSDKPLRVRLNIYEWKTAKHLKFGMRPITTKIALWPQYMEWVERSHVFYEKGQHPQDPEFSGWLFKKNFKQLREQICNPINKDLNEKIAVAQDGFSEDSKAAPWNRKRWKLGTRPKPNHQGKMPWEWGHEEFMDDLQGTPSKKQLGSDKFWQGQSPHRFLYWCESAEEAEQCRRWVKQSESYREDFKERGPGTTRWKEIWGEDSDSGEEE